MCHDKPLKRLPGEYCQTDDNCEIGLCSEEKKVCEVMGEDCKTSRGCNPGYYCPRASNTFGVSKCTKLKNVTENCSPSDPCQLNLVCNDNKCKEIGSIKNGSPATAPAACESFYLVNGFCQEFPTLVNETLECTNEKNICEYMNPATKNKIHTSCSCGVNTKGTSYCIPEVNRRVNDKVVRRSNKDVFYMTS